jgi:hypothetical protein
MREPQFPERCVIKMPTGFHAAVSPAARRKHMTVSEMLRQIIIAGLREAGVSIDSVDDRANEAAFQPGARA